MKFFKTLMVLVLSVVATSLFAANTAKAYLTFSTVGGEQIYSDDVKLFEDDADVLNTYDIVNNLNDYSVNAYAIYQSENYSKVKIANLNNLVIKFKANNHDLNYQLTFSNVSGKEINLVTESGDTLLAANDSVYDIVCTVLNQEFTFTVSMPQPTTYTRTVTSGSYGTICLPWASTKLEGGVFYNVLGEFDANQGVAMELVTSLQAGYPYVFLANSTEIKVTYDPATEVQTVQYDDNDFYGSFVLMNVPKDNYILMNNLLYKTADATSTIAANRAYFDVENMVEYQALPGRKVVFMGTEATGLNAVKAAGTKAQKVMINGQMVIIRDGKMFNAQGAEL